MRWQRSPLESGDFGENGVYLAEMAEMAINRRNCQTVNRNSNEMVKGPFGKWRFWQKWRKWRLIAEIAKL